MSGTGETNIAVTGLHPVGRGVYRPECCASFSMTMMASLGLATIRM